VAKCKSCGIEVEKGTEYCSNCEAKRKADESYLDSLLSSVMASEIQRNDSSRPKRSASSKEKETEMTERKKEVSSETKMSVSTDDPTDNSVVNNKTSVREYSIHDDTDDDFFDDLFKQDLDEFELDDEDRLDETDNIFPVEEKNTRSAVSDSGYEALDDLAAEGEIMADIFDDMPESPQDLLDRIHLSESKGIDTTEGEFPEMVDDILSEYPDHQDMAVSDVDPDEISDMLGELFEQAESTREEEPEESFPSFNNYDMETMQEEPNIEGIQDLFSGMTNEDLYSETKDMGIETPIPSVDDIIEENESIDTSAQMLQNDEKNEDQELFDNLNEDDDIMAFWNSINADEPEEGYEESLDKAAQTAGSNNASFSMNNNEVFDDSEIRDLIPDISDTDNGKKNAKRKRKGFLHKLFGNIKADRTPEEIEKMKAEALVKFEEDEIAAEGKKEADKLAKIEAKKKKEDDSKKNKEDKAAASEKKKEDKLVKLEKKKELKDKREQARRELLDEIENEEGKINKFGASFIFVLFAVILVVVVAGTNIYTYRVAIASADVNFELDRYDEAYDDVYGLDIQDEDIALYEKIITVMYVNKQLNSYHVFHANGSEAEALNSLLKGLMRYNKYIFYGTQLGIEDDLNGVRTDIVSALYETYGLTEEQADVLINSDSQAVYSARVYEVIDNLPAN